MKKDIQNSADDQKLIKLAMDGDMNSFRIIVDKYQDSIARIVISMIGNQNDADDIGQEVFIKFYKSMGNFKGESKLSTYLARIAINLSLNEIKRRSNRWLTTTDRIPDSSFSSSNTEETEDIRNIINTSLKKLEPDFRSVVVLRNIQGFSTKETAEILDIPQGTVLSRLARGHSKLKDIITKMDVI